MLALFEEIWILWWDPYESSGHDTDEYAMPVAWLRECEMSWGIWREQVWV